jgi:F0F1-type ATP synthase membrane subunit b/b'
MLWMNENRGRLQSELGTNSIGVIGKEAGRQWREIGDEVKSEYDEKAAELKREYEAELQKFLAAGGVATKKSRGKAKKDPNAPKKPLTTYMRWLQDNRQQIVDSLPEGQRGVAAVAKAAGVQWKQVSEDEKRRYQDLVEAAKVEYQKQLEEYSARAA